RALPGRRRSPRHRRVRDAPEHLGARAAPAERRGRSACGRWAMSVLLDGRFRFDNYVVGASNRLAVAAARAVAESPGASYNPLFTYSPSGLVNTHPTSG